MSGGGKGSETSSSQGMSRSSSFTESGTFVDPNQQRYLDFLRSQATGVASGQIGNIGNVAGNLAGTLMGVGGQAVGSLASGLGGDLAGLRGQLTNFSPQFGPVSTPQADISSFSQEYIAPTIEALGEDINRQLARQLGGAGGIDAGFAAGGTLGGGRNMVERGLAQEAAINQFGQAAANIRLQDAQQRQQLAANQALQTQSLGQQAQALNQAAGLQGGAQQLAALQAAGGIGQSELGGAQAALGSLSGLQQLGLSPFAAEFAPLASLAGIIGGPTVLSQAVGGSESISEQSSQSQKSGGFGGLLSGLGGFMGGYGTLLGAL